jgi:hypothetical protein
MTYIHIAKQRLSKQASTIETVFYGIRAASVTMPWFGKHATTDTLLSAWSVARNYLEDNRRCKADEGSVVGC